MASTLPPSRARLAERSSREHPAPSVAPRAAVGVAALPKARRSLRRLGALALALCAFSGPATARTLVDRVVARFSAPDIGGIRTPRFVLERELSFEARLEALADASFAVTFAEPYLQRHVRAALERHMAESLLEAQTITPPPTRADIDARIRLARASLADAVGGEARLVQALEAEGIESGELYRLLWRRARASLYLDRMVASMLTPTDSELVIVHRTMATPFSGQPYERIAPELRRWYVAQRLNTAVRAFYESARSRIVLELTDAPRGGGAAPPTPRPRARVK